MLKELVAKQEKLYKEARENLEKICEELQKTLAHLGVQASVSFHSPSPAEIDLFSAYILAPKQENETIPLQTVLNSLLTQGIFFFLSPSYLSQEQADKLKQILS